MCAGTIEVLLHLQCGDHILVDIGEMRAFYKVGRRFALIVKHPVETVLLHVVELGNSR